MKAYDVLGWIADSGVYCVYCKPSGDCDPYFVQEGEPGETCDHCGRYLDPDHEWVQCEPTKLRHVPFTVLRQSDILACPFAIFDPTHYRADGRCKCDDAQEQARMMREWDYTPESFTSAGVRLLV